MPLWCSLSYTILFSAFLTEHSLSSYAQIAQALIIPGSLNEHTIQVSMNMDNCANGSIHECIILKRLVFHLSVYILNSFLLFLFIKVYLSWATPTVVVHSKSQLWYWDLICNDATQAVTYMSSVFQEGICVSSLSRASSIHSPVIRFLLFSLKLLYHLIFLWKTYMELILLFTLNR